MADWKDDQSTLVPDDRTERTLLSDSGHTSPQPCHFLRVSLEVRQLIYRYFCISGVECTSHPRLWAPTGPKRGWHKTGYFERDTVLPLLLTCWQVHDEAAEMLYGENIFAFHISVISQGPILFFQWLAPRYVRLLRKVYIRTGFNVDTYDYDCDDGANRSYGRHHPSTMMEVQKVQDLSTSAALIKQAWPSMYHVQVDKMAILLSSRGGDQGMWTRAEFNNWPRGAFHLWKMVVLEVNCNDFRPEFRRVQWVKDLISHD